MKFSLGITPDAQLDIPLEISHEQLELLEPQSSNLHQEQLEFLEPHSLNHHEDQLD